MSDFADYESESEDDVLVIKFGNDKLVEAYHDDARTRELINQGPVVTDNAILAASYAANRETLQMLLSIKPNPNGRLSTADDKCDVEKGWAESDLTPYIGVDKREWYPIQYAATTEFPKEKSAAVIRILLRYGANLFAVFKQPIWRNDPYPFAGQTSETQYPADDYLERMAMVEGEWQRKPDPECGYGLRSVLHSLLEDGAYIESFLDDDYLPQLDLEHRDPQGRTLIHSACRNAVGADAFPSAIFRDVLMPNFNSGLTAPDDLKSSIFHTLRNGGANLAAVDYSGKSILHHLLEARSSHPYDNRPPLTQHTLAYILDHEHELGLINRPDKYGTYPLHTALQRLRGQFHQQDGWIDDSPLDQVVEILLNAGADAGMRDSRGNTMIHYLADNGLTEQWRGTIPRALCLRAIAAGVDVNARNDLGQSALEMIFDDDGERCMRLWQANMPLHHTNPPPLKEDIDREVFAMFDRAGARWTELNTKGQTLLHVVARHSNEVNEVSLRTEYLLSKRVDPGIKDHEGKTAWDIAQEVDNEEVLQTLRTHGSA